MPEIDGFAVAARGLLVQRPGPQPDTQLTFPTIPGKPNMPGKKSPANSIGGDFVYDDGAAIKKNNDVSGNGTLSDIFVHDCKMALPYVALLENRGWSTDHRKKSHLTCMRQQRELAQIE